MTTKKPINAIDIPANQQASVYPAPFAERVQGRIKRKLGNYFELSNFGVNLTTLAPNAISALKHQHLTQDEFIYLLTGELTLVYGDKEYCLQAGDCFGFKAGENIAHQLINQSDNDASYLEIGDRSTGDRVEYPDDDLRALSKPDGNWQFTHKDGRPY